MARRFVVYTDGASRGNPGPASIGAVVYQVGPDGLEELTDISEPIGIATNNVAEYQAVIAALELVEQLDPDEVLVRADSQLLVRQLSGEYRVKATNLKPLHQQIQEVATRLGRVRFEHVPREKNRVADGLANDALDRS